MSSFFRKKSDSKEEELVIASPEEDGESKRDRLKNALNKGVSRTLTQIDRVKESRDRRKGRSEREDASNDSIDDFLAGGRASSVGSQPSVISTNLSPAVSPKTEEGDFQANTPHPLAQPSVRRVPVPRINVSTSTRFPNARDVSDPIMSHRRPGSEGSNSPGRKDAAGLCPTYTKGRSQSSSSFASAERKARIRGLNVGFVESSPVIIGEGGDEAEQPVTAISQARSRTKSNSPLARKPVPSPQTYPPVIPNDSGFIPKPVSRTQTGMNLGLKAPHQSQAVIEGDEEQFVPNKPSRVQTGGSELSQASTSSDHDFLPKRLVRSGTLDLAQEFEMSLGINPNATKPKTGTPIFAPIPQRAPPSYAAIEGQGQQALPQDPVRKPPPQFMPRQQPSLRMNEFQKPGQASNQHHLPQHRISPNMAPQQPHSSQSRNTELQVPAGISRFASQRLHVHETVDQPSYIAEGPSSRDHRDLDPLDTNNPNGNFRSFSDRRPIDNGNNTYHVQASDLSSPVVPKTAPPAMQPQFSDYVQKPLIVDARSYSIRQARPISPVRIEELTMPYGTHGRNPEQNRKGPTGSVEPARYYSAHPSNAPAGFI